MRTPASPAQAAPPLQASELARFVELNAALDASLADPERRRALRGVLAFVERGLADPPGLIAGLPRAIGEAMESRGWRWNGFYALGEDGRLHLGPAHGPPVCSPLELQGGALSSGMCFDALLTNQTLAAYDVSAWPGYVSCDGESGLSTVSSIVSPIRDPDGRPFAVWDLDSTQRIEPGDVRFCDVLFASLARCTRLEPAPFR